MAKKIFKEKQTFSDQFLTIMLLVLGALIAARAVKELIVPGDRFTEVLVVASTILFIVGGVLWYLHNLKLVVTVTKKKISFDMKPLSGGKQHILWKEVSCCEIVDTPELAQWQGANITFNHERRFSVCGRNGLHLTTKDGRDYLIGSNKLTELEIAVKKVYV